MNVIRVAVVDDQALLVSAFVSLISAADDMVVAGTAADGREAVDLCRTTPVDVVLMDIRMPVMDGVEATRQLMRLAEPPGVIILTTFNRDDYVTNAVLAGARAFLLKDAATEEFLGAIRAVHRGQGVIAEEATVHVLDALRASRHREEPQEKAEEHSQVVELLARTTAREREVLLLVGGGSTNTEIARTLCVAETTVKTHVSSLLAKLQCRDRVSLVVLAHTAHLI